MCGVTTTVVTLLFGPYITSVAKAAANALGNIDVFGFQIDYRAYYADLISLSVITQVLVLPILGSIADSSPRKKWLLAGLLVIVVGVDKRDDDEFARTDTIILVSIDPVGKTIGMMSLV